MGYVCVCSNDLKSTSKAYLFHSSHRFVHSIACWTYSHPNTNWAHISPKLFPTKPGPPESSGSVNSISTDPATQVNRNSIPSFTARLVFYIISVIRILTLNSTDLIIKFYYLITQWTCPDGSIPGGTMPCGNPINEILCQAIELCLLWWEKCT